MKKFSLITFILSFTMLLFLSACSLTWNISQNSTDWTTNLPENEVTSIVKDFAKQLTIKGSDIQAETFKWYNHASQNYEWYDIDGYTISTVWIKNDEIPSATKYFDGWIADYLGDSIAGWLISYTKDDIVCYFSTFYEQEIPEELIAREWDLDDEEYNKAREAFYDTATNKVTLTCGFLPEWIASFQDLYFDAMGQEPFRNASIRWNHIARFDTNWANDYYLGELQAQWNNLVFGWWDELKWIIKKANCVDDAIWEQHDYQVTFTIEWDMVFQWCADKVNLDSDLKIWEEWTLSSLAKKVNYKYQWSHNINDMTYMVLDIVNNYFYLDVFIQPKDWDFESYRLVLEKAESGRNVIYEWGDEVDHETCEELNQYDSNLMEMFFFLNCPRG